MLHPVQSYAILSNLSYPMPGTTATKAPPRSNPHLTLAPTQPSSLSLLANAIHSRKQAHEKPSLTAHVSRNELKAPIMLHLHILLPRRFFAHPLPDGIYIRSVQVAGAVPAPAPYYCVFLCVVAVMYRRRFRFRCRRCDSHRKNG